MNQAYDFYREILPNVFYKSKEYGRTSLEITGEYGDCEGRKDGEVISNNICTLQNNINTQLLFGNACFIQYRALEEKCKRTKYNKLDKCYPIFMNFDEY